MRSYTTKLTVAALAAATALSLAACGPDNDPAANGGATGAAPSQTGAATGGAAAGGSTAAPSGAATGGAAAGGAATGGAATGGAAGGGAAAGGAGTAGAAGGGAGGGKLPQAGTSVKFGQPASIDFTDKTSNVAAKLQWTVTGIEPGSIKDFQDAKANTAGLDGRALFYVSWTMTNQSDTKLSFTAPNSKLKVYDANGNTASFANPVSSTPIAKCPPAPSFSGATKGVAFKGCDIVSFPAGSTPVMVGYGDSTDITKVQAAWTK
ncbi:hypothetical protein ACH4E7_20295 [Kitasatospora sp. NPDC018058]|uniref:hypothetical protein n=1 Tax=Kitasatospora sp. NPDC018058 TaxID=3364025 RepID=UPI0037BE6F3C